MRRLFRPFRPAAWMGVGLWFAGLLGPAHGSSLELLHVSYDPTRELFAEYNHWFGRYYQETTGRSVSILQSHGGSAKQARAVVEGLRADLVSLALAYDVDMITRHRWIHENWKARVPNEGAPFYSTIVFVVRRGNPKSVADWDDLLQPGLQLVMPNPKTSGGARWIFLAAWGHATLRRGMSEPAAEAFMRAFYAKAPMLDAGARASTQTFVKKAIGDVFLTWENEAHLALREFPEHRLEIIHPPASILARPAVSVVDRNTARKGSAHQAAAEAYLRMLYAPEAQELAARHGFRPSDPAVEEAHRSRFPRLQLFTLEQVSGDWAGAQQRFFAEEGLLDRITRR
jgi:sulfate/thiosulfate transport system substrate-binding protein